MMLDVCGARRGLRPPLLACLIAVLTLAWPAAAGATQRDKTSATSALRAYRTYMTRFVAEQPAWETKAGILVSSITSNCPNALAPINLLPQAQVDPGALTAFGEEAGADLALQANQADLANFERLRRTLDRLRWSSRSARSGIARFVKAGQSYAAHAQSDLCGDARALAADNAASTPPGTLIWLAHFSGVAAERDHGLTAFQRTVKRFETPVDRGLITHIDQLASRGGNEQQAFVTGEIPKILTAFGLTS